MHPMDAQPERFGWRIWQLDETHSRLLSPMYKGELRTGQRFFEARCKHKPKGANRFALGEECGCGIYYGPDRRKFLEDIVAGGNSRPVTGDFAYAAATFGAAAGDFGPDPLAPEKWMRTSRYSIFRIVLFERSSAAGLLRQRYGANVRVGSNDLGAEFLAEVEDAVRVELRDTKPSTFFADLRREPETAAEGHIIDRFPDQFGWKLWRINPSGRLEGIYDCARYGANRPYQRPTTRTGQYVETDCPHGNDVPSASCGCGIYYFTSLTYCRTAMMTYGGAELDAGWSSTGPWAFTFGFADGGIEDDPDPAQAPFSKRTRRFWPLTTIVSEMQRSLRPQIRRNFDAEVDWVTSTHSLRDAERDIRTRLQNVSSLDELKS